MAERGKLIVFEGLDGSGKSTQIRLLAERLKARGRAVFHTAEPTDAATGRMIRETLRDGGRGAAELAALFLTDRIAHNHAFRGILNAGTDVISDRYYYSSFAYQGTGTDLKWVVDMNRNCPDILRPDLCVFLDLDPQTCEDRIAAGRDHREIYENLATLKAVRARFYEVFRMLDGKENIRVVDAGRPMEEVADEIERLVTELYK